MINNPKTDAIIRFIANFIGFSIEGVDDFYNKKFQRWIYDASHEKQLTGLNTNGEERRAQDAKGNFINATYSAKTQYGMDLTHNDFILYEFKILNNIDAKHLTIDQSKVLEFYKDYLNNKKLQDGKKAGKPQKDYKTEGPYMLLDMFASGTMNKFYNWQTGRLKDGNNFASVSRELFGVGNGYTGYVNDSCSGFEVNRKERPKNVWGDGTNIQRVINDRNLRRDIIIPEFNNRVEALKNNPD